MNVTSEQLKKLRACSESIKWLDDHGGKMDIWEAYQQVKKDWKVWILGSGKIGFLKYLIKNGANINVKDDDGGTPLHWASYYGYDNCVKLLIKNGANVNARDVNNRTPLHDVALSGYSDCVKLLIRHGANVNSRDTDGMVPLDHAMAEKNIECIKILERNSKDKGKK